MTWFWIVLIIAVDQITKILAAANGGIHQVIIPGFFSLNYLENTGAAWSMFSNRTVLLTLISAFAIGLMLWYLLTHKTDRWTKAALVLMIGGAAGNFIDRLCLSYVRDFLDFYIFGYDFPVFNVADMALTIGVIVLVIAALKGDPKK
jgi:signal peptidase II